MRSHLLSYSGGWWMLDVPPRGWGGWGGVLGQVLDREAQHRPSTRNVTRVKKGGQNYTFCPILMKNRGCNTTFSSFSLKYRVETIQNFQRPEKGGSKWRSICSNLHIVSPTSDFRQRFVNHIWLECQCISQKISYLTFLYFILLSCPLFPWSLFNSFILINFNRRYSSSWNASQVLIHVVKPLQPS